MKKLFTLAILGSIAFFNAFGQNAHLPNTTRSKSVTPIKDDRYYQRLDRLNSIARSGNSASRATVCDTGYILDLSLFDYVYRTSQQQLNYTGSWYEQTPQIFANEITRFVDTANALNNTYVTVLFDSLAFVGGSLQSPTFDYIPLSLSTVYIDSVELRYGLSGDSSNYNNNDSLIFKIQKVQSSALVTVAQRSVVGQDLLPYYTGGSSVRAGVFPINYQLNQGDAFAIRVEFKGADTSRHFFLTYGFADSCGTITFQGQTLASPAIPSIFAVNNYFGQIRANGATATVQNANNGFAYQIPNTPVNCTFVYDQNYDIIPYLNICNDFSAVVATVAPSTAQGCPGATINLEGKVYGITAAQAPNVTFAWATSSGTLTANSGQTTSLVLGNSNATVTLTVSDGTNTTTSTLTITSNGITASFSNPNQTLACGGSLTLAPTTGGVITGRTYNWSTGASSQTLVVNTPNTYTVTVTNNRGCSATASASVAYPNVNNTVDFTLPSNGSKPYLCQNVSYTFTNNSTKQGNGWSAVWDFGDGNQSLLDNGVNTYSIIGNNIPVKVTMDSVNCKFTSSTKTVNVRNCTGVSELSFEKSISLMPNPSNGQVTIEIPNTNANVTIKIYNMLGAEVTDITESASGSFIKTLNLSDLSNGNYIVKVKSGDKIATKRLTISK
jgi:hypothetical protein